MIHRMRMIRQFNNRYRTKVRVEKESNCRMNLVSNFLKEWMINQINTCENRNNERIYNLLSLFIVFDIHDRKNIYLDI